MKSIRGRELVKEDMQQLMQRLNGRMEDALRMFSQKRTRDHFKEIFFNRYKVFSTSELSDIPNTVFSEVVSYYEGVDEIYWYLMSTEDMPSLVESNVLISMKKINKLYGKVFDELLSDETSENHSDIADSNISEEESPFESSSFDDAEFDDDKQGAILDDIEDEAPPPFLEDEN